MKIKFCGAAQHVTGSSHLITLEDGFTILLDCGLYQGSDDDMDDFNSNWYVDPEKIDCLILSHAHIDHSGRIPKLVKDGFRGHIYATHATRSLCGIMLLDSAKIQEFDAEYHNRKLMRDKKNWKRNQDKLKEPLYTEEIIPQTMSQFVGISYEHWIKIHPDVKVLFRDAGHILGSASITLHIREGDRIIRFGFSGDIGRPQRPILRDPIPMPELDYLICESTYGDKDHDTAPAEAERLLRIIKRTCVENKGKLIIPAFSIGRTQEVVYMLDQMENKGLLPHIPVYVDSPLAVNATRIFGNHEECFDKQLQKYLLQDDNPFGFNNLNYISDVKDSKALNTSEEPCIIISASGMMNAGRVRHHIANNIEDPNNTLLVVGYCAPNTLGRILLAGVKSVKLFGEQREVNFKIETMDSFSAHADRGEIIDFIKNEKGKVKKIFLVHGEIDRQTALKKLMNREGFKDVEIPALGDEFELH